MHIPSYKIHNVLKVYSKQISEERLTENGSDGGGPDESGVTAARPNGGKRDSIIDRVTRDIINKISHFGSSSRPEKGITQILENDPDRRDPAAQTNETRFTFTAIDTRGEKSSRTLSLEDSDFVISRLAQPANRAEERKIKS